MGLIALYGSTSHTIWFYLTHSIMALIALAVLMELSDPHTARAGHWREHGGYIRFRRQGFRLLCKPPSHPHTLTYLPTQCGRTPEQVRSGTGLKGMELRRFASSRKSPSTTPQTTKRSHTHHTTMCGVYMNMMMYPYSACVWHVTTGVL